MSKFEEILENHKIDPTIKHWYLGPKVTDQEVKDFWAQKNEQGGLTTEQVKVLLGGRTLNN